MRLDKFIWSTRLAKTRSKATELVQKEKVKLQGVFCKPSKEVTLGNIISIKSNPIWRTYLIQGIPSSRVGAKLVYELITETTSEKDLLLLEEKILINKQNNAFGIKGRPTKRDRRKLDDFEF